MYISKLNYLLTGLLLITQSVFAQDYTTDSVFIKKMADDILKNKASYNNLYYLTKKIGGRLAGSPQMVMAEQWGANALKEAGADNIILQECMVPHWVRGKKEYAFLYNGKNKQSLNITVLGNSMGTGNKAVKAGVVQIKSFEELEKRKEEIKGKIVFYDIPFEETFVRTFQAYSQSATYRSNGASRAAKYGAVAVLVRSMSHAMDNHPHTGAMNYNDSFPKIPAAALGLEDVAVLSKKLADNSLTEVELFTSGKFLPDTIGHNVIGELKGSLYPEKIITIGGHLDSWDLAEGAHDDGAGVVQTIEVLRAFKAAGYQPKHTIRFVLFANEENGLRGGRKYAEEAKAKNEQHVFALESDAGGFTPRGFGFSVPEESWNKIQPWKTLLAPYYGDEFTKGGGGADIGPLARTLNVPVAGLTPDSQRYFDVHHAKSDVFEAVNIRELKLGAINMAALIYLIDKYGL